MEAEERCLPGASPPFLRWLSDYPRTILGPPSDHPRTKNY